VLDFLRVFLREVLQIGHQGKTSLTKEEKENIPTTSDSKEGMNRLVYKMSLYLSKMAMHDYHLSGRRPSLVAIGCLYVALKICEQLKKVNMLYTEVVRKIIAVAKDPEDEIIEVSQKVLYLAQNFDKAFPGLENLKKTHFVCITTLL